MIQLLLSITIVIIVSVISADYHADLDDKAMMSTRELLNRYKKMGFSACIAPYGHRDGLGWTMIHYNSVMKWATSALHPGVSFSFSPLHIKAHNAWDSFENIFYDPSEDYDGSCQGVPVHPDRTFELVCPNKLYAGECENPDQTFVELLEPIHGAVFIVNITHECCGSDNQYADTRQTYIQRYTRPGSGALVKDLNETPKDLLELREKKTQFSRKDMLNYPFEIVLHVRNGDVLLEKRPDFSNFHNPYENYACILPLLVQIPNVHFTVITEIVDDSSVIHLRQALLNSSITEDRIHIPISLTPNAALRHMTEADILIVNDRSTFGHFASMMLADKNLLLISNCRGGKKAVYKVHVGRPYINAYENDIAEKSILQFLSLKNISVANIVNTSDPLHHHYVNKFDAYHPHKSKTHELPGWKKAVVARQKENPYRKKSIESQQQREYVKQWP